MRQLKQFLRAKKGICSNECKCITINMWRCADLQGGDEFCGCGEGGSSLPPLRNVIHPISEVSALFFNDVEEGSYLDVSIETDPETGDSRIYITPYGVFADERYVVQEGYTVWDDTIGMIDVEAMRKVIYGYSKRPSKIFEALNEVYKNPTEENVQAAEDIIGERIPRDELENVMEATSENSAEVLMYYGYSIEYNIETDAETGLPRVVVTPTGDFDSDWFMVDGENIWSSVFTDGTATNMKYWLNWTSEFPSDVFNTINAVFQDPTPENIQAANNAIIGWKPTIYNKASGSYENGTSMFVGPDLEDGSCIRVNLETDPETGDNLLVVEGYGIFDPEGTYGEGASLLIGAFESMSMEWIQKWILGVSWLSPYIWDLGTINSDFMSLVQAIYDDPTEANQQALITFLLDRDLSQEQNPLIIDDDQVSRIREGLEIVEPEDVQAVIIRSDEGGQSWETLVVEDYYTYYLMAVSENSADIRVYVGDYMYQASVSVETDQETEESRVVVGECFPAPYLELDEQ